MIGPMKKKVITSVVLTAFVMIVIFGVVGGIYIATTSREMSDLKAKKADAKAYVLTRDMTAGNVISATDIKLVEIRNESAASDSFDDRTAINDIVGRRLKVNAREKTIVTESLFYEEENSPSLDTRLQEFNMITLPSDLDEGDYIDVRIRFQTGEDYAVLVGKRVESFGATGAEGNTIFIRLNEEEIVRMGSAIIESYINNGVNLYANKYVDPSTQLFEYKHVDLVAAFEEARYDTISGETTIGVSGELLTSEDKKVERSNSEIARIIGVSEDEVELIKDAIENNDEDTLKTYRSKIITSQKSIVANYPVKAEVATLIHNNPNILDEIKAKYDIAALEMERQHLLSTDLTKVDELTGEVTQDEEHISNITGRLEKEIETQKNERQEYLLNLLAQASETNN